MQQHQQQSAKFEFSEIEGALRPPGPPLGTVLGKDLRRTFLPLREKFAIGGQFAPGWKKT